MSTCSGYSSIIRPTCWIESFAAAIPRGLAKGGGQGVPEIFKEAVKGMNFEGVGAKTASFIQKEGKSFFDNLNFEGVGTKTASFIQKEGNSFFNTLNFDSDKFVIKLADKINDSQDTFFKKLDASKFTNNLGNQFDKGLDGLDIAGRAQTVGNELKDAMDGFTLEIGEGLQKSFSNVVTGIRNEFIFKQLPYFLAASMLATVVSVGTPLALWYLYYKAKHNIGKPKLATETNQIGLFNRITSLLPFSSSKAAKPIYDQNTTRRVTEISKSIQNIRKNGGYFQNVLFYGPGGTGKTMISHFLAKESGMSYVKMSGGDLAQYIKRGEHVTELNKLFDSMTTSWRPWSTRPWILFIDEAESLCKDRGSLPSAELLELQNAFLNRTGTQSKKFMLMMATNRMEDLDPAVLSRMDHKIYIGPPEEAERVTIIKSYLPQFFSKNEIAELFDEASIQTLAKSTDGFTGRSLFKLLNAIANHKAMTEKNSLTKQIVDQTVRDFVEQEEEVRQRLDARKAG